MATWIFWNRKILLAVRVQSFETHQHAKFHQNRSIIYEDIKFFSIFQDGGNCHLVLSNLQYFISWRCLEGLEASLYQISSKSVVPLRQYCDFSNLPPSWIFEIVKYYWQQGWIGSTPSKLVNRLRRHCDFSLLQNGGRRHLALSYSQIFIGWRCSEGPDAKLYQILSKSVAPLQRYCDFSNFQDGRRRHLTFLNGEFLLANGVHRIETHQHAKYRQNQSIGCEDIKIFWFFKMMAVHHLGFVWGISVFLYYLPLWLRCTFDCMWSVAWI